MTDGKDAAKDPFIVSFHHGGLTTIAEANINILGSKSLPNMRRGSEASIVRGTLETFTRNFKSFWKPAELKNELMMLPTPTHVWQTFGA